MLKALQHIRTPGHSAWKLTITTVALAIFTQTTIPPLNAQETAPGWDTNLDNFQTSPTVPTTPAPENTTIAPRTTTPQLAAPPADQTATGIKLVAFLTEGGQEIDRGLVWRIFEQTTDTREPTRLLSTQAATKPLVNLRPGKYVINVAFGRAYLTKTIVVRAGNSTTERFVLNAGGLKLLALVEGQTAPRNAVSYDILEGEPGQSGERKTVISNVKPQLIVRLNAGIYRIKSRYGDANASVIADVQVEAGKMTVATVAHKAAQVTFKLVEQTGGEALPGIQWSIATPEGDLIKKSVGALPTHILAPGTYVVTAVAAGGTYQAEFAIEDGQMASVEVVMN